MDDWKCTVEVNFLILISIKKTKKKHEAVEKVLEVCESLKR
jgi:hypothetical protein